MWHDQVQYKPAEHGGATTWHQDAPLWPSILPNTMITAWIPFDEVTAENGAMWMLPASHTWGDQIATGAVHSASEGLTALEGFGELQMGEFQVPHVPDSAPIGDPPRPCPVARGQVHFHHSLTWHGSPENQSPRRRRAIAIHYMTGETYFVAVRTELSHGLSPTLPA